MGADKVVLRGTRRKPSGKHQAGWEPWPGKWRGKETPTRSGFGGAEGKPRQFGLVVAATALPDRPVHWSPARKVLWVPVTVSPKAAGLCSWVLRPGRPGAVCTRLRRRNSRHARCGTRTHRLARLASRADCGLRHASPVHISCAGCTLKKEGTKGRGGTVPVASLDSGRVQEEEGPKGP